MVKLASDQDFAFHDAHGFFRRQYSLRACSVPHALGRVIKGLADTFPPHQDLEIL